MHGATLVSIGHAIRTPCALVVIAITIVIDLVSDCYDDDDEDEDEEQAQDCLQCGLCRFGIRRLPVLAGARAMGAWARCWFLQEFLPGGPEPHMGLAAQGHSEG